MTVVLPNIRVRMLTVDAIDFRALGPTTPPMSSCAAAELALALYFLGNPSVTVPAAQASRWGSTSTAR
jgi:hypothetical protein